MNDSLIPISDEQAKLGQEALRTLGGFLKETFGTLPQDVVGLLGGDYLKVKRAENLFRMFEKAKRRIEDKHIVEPEAPPALALPIMIAAADESRDELLDLWAALMAAVVDPERKGFFRLKFIEVAKRMDPLDAPVLQRLSEYTHPVDHVHRLEIATRLQVSLDQVLVSIANLEELGLVATGGGAYTNSVLPLGRELLKAIESSGAA